MKLAIISDTHLGYGYGSEREQEGFENAQQAFELAVKNNADAILFAGDFFDSDIPSQETWHRTFELLKTLQNSKSGISEIKILDREGNERAARQKGLPIIAIHGTHEFRGKGYKNALEVLESAGFIIHIHASKAIIEIAGEKIAIQGLGGVPEKKALDALKAWNPEPEKNARKIRHSRLYNNYPDEGFGIKNPEGNLHLRYANKGAEFFADSKAAQIVL